MQSHYIGPYRVESIKGVIVWVKSIATGKKLRIYSDRVILEENMSKSDCSNVRACYPIKVPEKDWLENELEENLRKDRSEINEDTSDIGGSNEFCHNLSGDEIVNDSFETRSIQHVEIDNESENDFEGFEDKNIKQSDVQGEIENDFEGFAPTVEENFLNKELPVAYEPRGYRTRSKVTKAD